MPVPSSISDLSPVAGSNSPAGSESPSLIDDYLRANASFIAQLRDGKLPVNDTVTTIASATLTDIGAATTNSVIISGTTTITGLGTVAAGARRTVKFSGILTLTHNATSLILPGGFNILTAVNDSAEFQSLGSGNWICLRYDLAAVKPGLVLGTVSQSGGAATGAIIESGSNGNGLYTRFASGLQICISGPTITTGSLATNSLNVALYNFAAAFIDTNYVNKALVTPASSNDHFGSVGDFANTNIQGAAIIRNGATAAQTFNIRYVAIGRWF